MGLDRARWDSLVGACPTHRVEAAGGEHRRKRRRGFLKAAVVVRKSTGLKTRLALARLPGVPRGPQEEARGRAESWGTGGRRCWIPIVQHPAPGRAWPCLARAREDVFDALLRLAPRDGENR